MIIRRAYTLVEILVVIGLILVLSTVVITVINPNLQQNRSKDAVIKKAVSDIAGTIEIFKSVYGRYPTESDVSLLQAYVSNGYTVYNVTASGLLGFNNPAIDVGEGQNSVYWDPSGNGCLQAALNEEANTYSSWTPGGEVQVGGNNCSSQIVTVITTDNADSGPTVVGGGGAAGTPAPPVGSEYNQSSGNPKALMAHYKMDEADVPGGGGTMVDSSGRSNNGVFNGNAYHSIGVVGSAINLTNSDQYASAPTMLGSPRSLTMSAWVNPTSVDSAGGEVLSIGDNVAIRIRNNGSTKQVWAFYHDGTNWPGVTYPIDLVGKGWVHLTFVFDDSAVNYQKIYINGEFKAEASHDKSIVYKGLGNVTSMGRHGNPTYNAFDLQGRIDEVKVYNYVRTDDQIREEYESTKLADVPDPIVYLKLDEGSGDTANDSQGSHNGNLGGSETCPAGSNCPQWIAGQFGNALDFDKTQNDIVSGSGSINFTTDFTISGWIKTTSSGAVFGTVGSGLSNALQVRVESGVMRGLTSVSSSWTQYDVRGSKVVNDGNWHHFAFVMEGVDLKMYVDGVLDKAETIPGNSAFTDNTWYLGYSEMSWSTNYYTGGLDEFRMFDYALTPEQVNAEYRR